LPFYFRERGGLLISAAINQYVKIFAAFRPLDNRILIQTTDVQFTDHFDDVRNKIIKEVLRYFGIKKSIQIATFTTIPTGIGLGTSSTSIVGLVKAISTLIGKSLHRLEIAEIAYRIEREILKFPGGIQDQYIAALGGIQILQVDTLGKVTAEPLIIKDENRQKLEKGLILIYLGKARESGEVINSQKTNIKKTLEIYDKIKELGKTSVEYLINADIRGLGEIMDEHWELKKQLSERISSNYMEDVYKKFKSLGSPGGKLVGAGGGGFFMMVVPEHMDAYTNNIEKLGFRHLKWQFEFEGTHIIDSKN